MKLTKNNKPINIDAKPDNYLNPPVWDLFRLLAYCFLLYRLGCVTISDAIDLFSKTQYKVSTGSSVWGRTVDLLLSKN